MSSAVTCAAESSYPVRPADGERIGQSGRLMGMIKNRLKYSAALAGASLAVLPLMLTGQAGHSAQLADRGTVTGVLELVGGPAPGRSFPEPGTVTAHRHGVAIM